MGAQRTALITGVSGQDGWLLAELLLARGYRVVGVARKNAARSEPACPPGVDLADVDLHDQQAVRSALASLQPHEVYHFAAAHYSSQQSSHSKEAAIKDAMVSTNFLATKNLAISLCELSIPCHLVFASSSQIFTPTQPIHRINEASPRCPSTFYGSTKSWAMDLLSHLRRDNRAIASNAILFNHESVRRTEQFVTRKITLAAAHAAAGKRPTLKLGNIGARVDWSSAEDVVEALSRMGRAAAPGDYVIGSNTARSVRDFLSLAFGSVDLDWAEFTSYDEESAGPALVGDSAKIELALGWQPRVTFEQLVTNMVAHDRRALR